MLEQLLAKQETNIQLMVRNEMICMDNKYNKINPLAIIGIYLSFFSSIKGFIACYLAYKTIKETHEDGEGLAIAGMIISVLRFIGVVIFYFFYFFVLLAFMIKF